MSSSYLSRAATPRSTPQSEPIPGSSQVKNAAGGFAWEIDSLARLRRFLILGSEGGSYYASEHDLTRENVEGVKLALDEHGVEAVQTIVGISQGGRAPKNDPAIYALAIASAHKDEKVKQAALASIPMVCRTGTHLMMFASFVEGQRGWGPALRKGVSAWYEGQTADELAYQAAKYRQRGGWTHRDLLRLAHPSAPSPEHKAIYDWICGRGAGETESMAPAVHALADAQASDSPAQTAGLIREHGRVMAREFLNPEHLSDPLVWQALLEQGMPITALIRNLATMTRVGLLAPFSEAVKTVVEQIANGEQLRKARVHPITILAALTTYASGHGLRGGHIWTPVPQITDALDAAFYAAFENVQPSGKNVLLALDVSASMDGNLCAGIPGLTARKATAAMALVTASVEPNYHALAFSDRLVDLSISRGQRLDDVVGMMQTLPFGGTDCALPMIWAGQQEVDVDLFAVYTDNETWAGSVHPAQALTAYRQLQGKPDARSAVVGMVASRFSIADPNDAGMLDLVGFDTTTPQVLSEFAEGAI